MTDQKQGTDFFYYNANYTNKEEKTIEAYYRDDNTQPIIKNPSDYNMSIVRFTCPGSLLPIFIFRPETYYVFLSYKGVVSDKAAGEVEYINIRDNLPVTHPLYYYVNDYNQFLTMVNRAYASAFTNLTAKAITAGTPLPAGSYRPYFTFDSSANLIKLVVQEDSYLATDPYALWPDADCDAIEVWADVDLAKFLSGFQVLVRTSFSSTAVYGVATDVYQKFIVASNGINNISSIYPDSASSDGWSSTVTYAIGDVVFFQGNFYISLTNANTGNVPTSTLGTNWNSYYGYNGLIMAQEYVALYTWNQPKFIVFVSTTLPIVPEQLPNSNINTSQVANYRKIISDFSLATNIGSEIRSTLTYNPSAEFRRISLTSTEPLYSVDVKPYWVDADGVFYPLYINPGDQITVKILFEKK